MRRDGGTRRDRWGPSLWDPRDGVSPGRGPWTVRLRTRQKDSFRHMWLTDRLSEELDDDDDWFIFEIQIQAHNSSIVLKRERVSTHTHTHRKYPFSTRPTKIWKNCSTTLDGKISLYYCKSITLSMMRPDKIE